MKKILVLAMLALILTAAPAPAEEEAAEVPQTLEKLRAEHRRETRAAIAACNQKPPGALRGCSRKIQELHEEYHAKFQALINSENSPQPAAGREDAQPEIQENAPEASQTQPAAGPGTRGDVGRGALEEQSREFQEKYRESPDGAAP